MEPPTGCDQPAQQAVARFGARLPIPFTVMDRHGSPVFANQAYCDLVGLPLEAVLARRLEAAIHPDEVDRARAAVARVDRGEMVEVELRTMHADGHWLHVAWGMQQDPDTGMVLIVALNITDQRRMTRALRHEADHDSLTGAANRSLVMRTLNDWVAQRTTAAVAIIDLDGFKQVNDRMGHRVGDEVLRTLVARLRELVPDDAVVGRMGGDEFVVLAPLEHQDALARFQAQLAKVSGPITVLDRRVRLSASVGVTVGTGETDPEHLLHQADVAAYVAKRGGRGRVRCYDESLRAEDARRRRIERQLTEALEGDGVEVHLQPIRALADGKVVGAEALARLRGPHGVIEAVEFIDIAEGLGLMRRIAQRVQDLALHALPDMP
ncbi:MAG TPA: diguanylate cyclase, partial [Euzebya sp.]|nr:diguanylate cyclase [Euzebya sp.]